MPNKNKKRLRNIGIFAIVCSLVIVFAAVGLVMCSRLYGDFVEYQIAKSRLPESGIYYCWELDATVSFETTGAFYCSNHNSNPIFVPQGIRIFYTESGDINGEYFWNQGQDVLEIKFFQYPEEFEENKMYIFQKSGLVPCHE